MAAFAKCSGLTSVTIGNSVTSIGYNAFTDCSSLQHLYSLAKNVPQAANAFEKGIAFSLATLHVPAESMYSYNAAEGWNKFINIVALTDEEMTDVKDLKFDAEDESSTIYNMNGVRQIKTQRGLNIIRMKDGTTRKIVVK